MLSSLYAQLPQTAETQLAAKMATLQSEVTSHMWRFIVAASVSVILMTPNYLCEWEGPLVFTVISLNISKVFLNSGCECFPSRINTRRKGWGAFLRASTPSCQKLLKPSWPRPSLSFRVRWDSCARCFTPVGCSSCSSLNRFHRDVPPGNVLHSPSTGRPARRKRRPACTTSSPRRWRRDTLKRLASCRVRYTLASAHRSTFKII